MLKLQEAGGVEAKLRINTSVKVRERKPKSKTKSKPVADDGQGYPEVDVETPKPKSNLFVEFDQFATIAALSEKVVNLEQSVRVRSGSCRDA